MLSKSPASMTPTHSSRPAVRPRGRLSRATTLFKLTADYLAVGVVLLACPVILSGVALHLA